MDHRILYKYDYLVKLAFWPFIVMLLNYAFALPGYVYINAVTGTGKTRLAFVFQLVTILIYLIYLYLLSECFHASLTVYMTAEYLFVILLGIQFHSVLEEEIQTEICTFCTFND